MSIQPGGGKRQSRRPGADGVGIRRDPALAAGVHHEHRIPGKPVQDVLVWQATPAAVAEVLDHARRRAGRRGGQVQPAGHPAAAKAGERHVVRPHGREPVVDRSERGREVVPSRLVERAGSERVEVGRDMHRRGVRAQFGQAQVGVGHGTAAYDPPGLALAYPEC